ncbi:MAG: hypothetical protein ACKPAJ_11660, partial [Actinomycetota bacterium]
IGGLNRLNGGNLRARLGYCAAVSAAVGTGTIVEVVEVDVFASATVVEVVDESLEAETASTPAE